MATERKHLVRYRPLTVSIDVFNTMYTSILEHGPLSYKNLLVHDWNKKMKMLNDLIGFKQMTD